MSRGRSIVAALAVLVGSQAGGARPLEAAADPGAVAWRALYYTAHKMGISASIAVKVSGPDTRPAGPGGAAAVADGLVVLESTTHLPGRVFLTREELDPASSTVGRIVDTETGAKDHRKTYTLTARGFFLDLLRPASRGEAAGPLAGWSDATRSFTGYPRELAPGTPVTGPIGLLYAMSAAQLAAPGDFLAVHVLVQTNVETVTVRVVGAQTVAADFHEEADGTKRVVAGPLPALRLAVESQPVDAEAASAFRIFGLGGDVEIVWDPVRRLPLEIAGSVKILGRVKVHLTSVTLR